MRKIGAHVSVAGGIDLAVDRAKALGCNCAQIFSGSPRSWGRGPLAAINTDKLFAKQRELDITPIVTHALYLVNLATDNEAAAQKSVDALTYDMQFDGLINGAGIVVHLGSEQGKGWEVVRDQVVKHIKTIIAASPKNATFLIENSAGQLGKLASNLEHIRWLLDQVNSPQLGWCFDTCHGFVAGYALGDVSAKFQSKHERNGRTQTAVDAIEANDLWSTLKCIHVNDSKGEFGSGLDRHENLGEGYIPHEDLKQFLNHPKLNQEIPLILEVPGFDNKGPDARNVELLKELVE